MITRKNESGSAHVIIIIILAAVILGLLGFVFWQNFIQKKDPVATADTTSTTVVKGADAETAKPVDTTKYVVIDTWNVKFAAPTDGTGITWAIDEFGQVGFSTSNLKTGEVCNAANAAAGGLWRDKIAYSAEGNTGVTIVPLNDSKPINGYYYAFALPNGDHCNDTNPSDHDETLKLQELLKTLVSA